MSLDNPFIKSFQVRETLYLLNEAVKWTGADITINWVRGHAGHLGNEIADGLAAEGTQIPITVRDQPLIAESMVKCNLKKAYRNKTLLTGK